MGTAYDCAKSLMNASCAQETVDNISGLVRVINDAIGCTFPLLPKRESNQTDTVVYANREHDRQVHVNINRIHQSAGSCNISSAIALILSAFLMTAFRWLYRLNLWIRQFVCLCLAITLWLFVITQVGGVILPKDKYWKFTRFSFVVFECILSLFKFYIAV